MSPDKSRNTTTISRSKDDLERKRRRKIWSCGECRRRKVQCDRTLPVCTRCSRADRSSYCVYFDDLNGIHSNETTMSHIRTSPVNGRFSHAAPQTSNVDLGAIAPISSGFQDLVHRLEYLESAIAHCQCRSADSAGSDSGIVAGKQPSAFQFSGSSEIHLRGKSFDTKFNGGTHVGLLIRQIPELHCFTREAVDTFPALEQVRHAMHQAEINTNITRSSTSDAALARLRSSLPTRSEADEMVRVYMDSYECIYHVLHLPDFKVKYESLWADEGSEDVIFLVLVLLIISVSLCLTSTPLRSQSHDETPARERATKIIQSCEDWLQSVQLRYTILAEFQVSFLLLFARQINARRYKQTWANAGIVIRTFMCAGLHRDPDGLKQETTTVDRELRRRLWLAAAEFELQASFEQGMSATPWLQQCDVLSPRNAPDEMLEDADETAESVDVFTESFYLSISRNSIFLRHSLNNLLNNPQSRSSFDEVKNLTDQILASLSAIPPCTNLKFKPASALLSLNPHQYQLALHLRQLHQSATPAEAVFSRSMMRESAKETIKIHKAVQANGSNALELLCGDHLRAALSICYIHSTANIRTNAIYPTLPQHAVFQLMTDVISLMKTKATRYSGDQRQLWVVIAADALMKSLNAPHKKEHFMHNAVEDFVNTFSDLLVASQPSSSRQGVEVLDTSDLPRLTSTSPKYPTLPCELPDNDLSHLSGAADQYWAWDIESLDLGDLNDYLAFD